VLLGVAACTEPTVIESWALESGRTITFQTPGACERSTEGRKLALRCASTRVTLQEIAVEQSRAEGDRTAHSVASALVRRVELGERPGELSSIECDHGARASSCVSGWMEIDGTRYRRSGVVFRTGDSIVWVDVAIPEAEGDAFEDRANAILASLRVSASS
jgi:hypothetical protein